MNARREVRDVSVGSASTPRPRGTRRAATETGSARDDEGKSRRSAGTRPASATRRVGRAPVHEIKLHRGRRSEQRHGDRREGEETRRRAHLRGVSPGRAGARRRSGRSRHRSQFDSFQTGATRGRPRLAQSRVEDAGAFSWQFQCPPPTPPAPLVAVRPRRHVVRRVGREPGVAPGGRRGGAAVRARQREAPVGGEQSVQGAMRGAQHATARGGDTCGPCRDGEAPARARRVHAGGPRGPRVEPVPHGRQDPVRAHGARAGGRAQRSAPPSAAPSSSGSGPCGRAATRRPRSPPRSRRDGCPTESATC
jgi:hypothetical protein